MYLPYNITLCNITLFSFPNVNNTNAIMYYCNISYAFIKRKTIIQSLILRNDYNKNGIYIFSGERGIFKAVRVIITNSRKAIINVNIENHDNTENRLIIVTIKHFRTQKIQKFSNLHTT